VQLCYSAAPRPMPSKKRGPWPQMLGHPPLPSSPNFFRRGTDEYRFLVTPPVCSSPVLKEKMLPIKFTILIFLKRRLSDSPVIFGLLAFGVSIRQIFALSVAGISAPFKGVIYYQSFSPSGDPLIGVSRGAWPIALVSTLPAWGDFFPTGFFFRHSPCSPDV